MTAFTVNMRSRPLFSLLALQLCTAVTSWEYSDMFRCPGQSFRIPRAEVGPNLFFQSSKSGSLNVQIANATHVFDPSYQYSPSEVLIPEVKKRHEGRYYWKNPDLKGFVSRSTKLILKDCSYVQDVDYGVMLELAVPKEADLLQFTPSGSKDHRILWSRINAEDKRGARGTVSRDHWTAYKIRFADAGRYTFLRDSGTEISSTTARIREGSRWHDVDTHDSWEDRVAVPVSEAVVTFTDVQNKQHVIFENSMMTEDALRIFEGRLFINTHLDVLQFEMSGADSKAVGRYEVTEKKGKAFVIDVAGGSGGPTIPDRAVPIALAASILTLFIIGCCVRRSSNKKKEAPSPATASAATPSAPAATPSAPSDPPVYIHGPVPRPEPAYQPGAQSRVEDIRDSPTTHSYDSPPPSYDELMANGPAPYVPYVPYVPPEGPTGAYGVPVIPTPAAPSAPSPPDYQYQPGGLSGTTSDFISDSISSQH